MGTTQPQFALPFVVQSTQFAFVTVTLSDLSTFDVDLPAGTYFNDRRFLINTLAVATALAIQAADPDVGAVWAASEVPGDYLGRNRIECTTRTDGLDAIKLVFNTGGDLWLGYASGGSSATNVFDAPFMAQRLWIPQPAFRINLVISEPDDEDFGIFTESPSGEATLDYYGTTGLEEIILETIPAAMVYQRYADQAGYAFNVAADMTAGDPNAPWDEFRKRWRDQANSGPCRYSEDRTQPGTFLEVWPRAPWIWRTSEAATRAQLEPLEYDFGFVVGVDR